MYSTNRKRNTKAIIFFIAILLMTGFFFYIRKSVFLMDGYSRLALSYQTEGKHNKAILYHQKALTVANRRSDKNCIITKTRHLADSYRAYKKYKQEASCYQELLKLTPKKNQSAILDLNVKLFIAYKKSGQLQKGYQLLQKTEDLYKTKKSKTNKDHLLYATICHEKGAPYVLEDSFEAQKTLLKVLIHNRAQAQSILINQEHVLEIRQQILGSDHLDTADTHWALGFLCFAMGKDTEAIHHFEEAWRIREQKLGSDHIDSIKALLYLFTSYDKNKQFNKAKDLATDLLTNLQKAKQHPGNNTWADPIITETKHGISILEEEVYKAEAKAEAEAEAEAEAKAKAKAEAKASSGIFSGFSGSSG